MKRNLIMIALAGVLAVTSCNKMDNSANEDHGGKVKVNFSLGMATKATSGIDDDAINSVYVFAFDGNRLDGSASITNANSGAIEVTPGERHFIAVVNPNSEFTFNAVSTPTAMLALVSTLSNEGLADMVMIGESTVTISDATTNVPISVKRLVSKISVSSLTFALTGANEGKTVSDVEVYIKNYPSTCAYDGTPGTSYTTGLLADNKDTFEVCDSYGDIVSGSNAVTGHQFFCYPRTTDSKVTDGNCIRLCVKGTIDGQDYYWSLPVNNGDTWKADAFDSSDTAHYGVARNHSYDYAITITKAGIPGGTGDDDPENPGDGGDPADDHDLTTNELTYTLTVLPFVEVASQTVTF